MSRSRSIPLLLAATACLAVAGCGSDDKPATTSASAPTTAVQPATTAPATTATTPTTTAPTPPTTNATTATTPTTTEDGGSTKADSGKTASPLNKLKELTKGGQPASEAETAAVRSAMRAFGEAIASRDAKEICRRTVGIDALLSQSGQKKATCESMFEASSNASSAPSKQELAGIASGKVTIKGDRATLNTPQGPMPMRKVDDTWKVDYGAFAEIAASSAAKKQ